MPDYRPIPGQMDPGSMNLPMDDLSQMAREKASSLLSPYADQMRGIPPQVGGVPSPGNGGEANPIANPVPKPISPPSEGMEDKLYRAVHPDTFSQILAMIMQFVTGKPIPKYQEGTDYVPKTGPAIVHQGEAIVPAEENISSRGPGDPWERQQGQVTSIGEEGTRGPGDRFYPPSSIGERAYKTILEPSVEFGKGLGQGIYGTYQKYIGQPFSSYVAEPIASDIRYMATGQRDRSIPTSPPLKGTPYGETIPPGGVAAPFPGQLPRRNAIDLKKDEGGAYAIPEPGWKDYTPEGQPTGIKYKLGEVGEPVRGPGRTPSPEEQEIAARDRWAQPGYAEAHPYAIPGYGRSYYEAHPEEKAAQEYYDMTRGPAPDSYEAGVERMKEMNLMDIVKNPNTTAEARKAAGEQLTALKQSRAERAATATKGAGDIYGKALEHGIGTPSAQEKLAHAEYLKRNPETHLEGIRLQNEAHIQGIRETVAGHLEAAKIAVGPKDQILKGLETYLQKGSERAGTYGQAFDAKKEAGEYITIMKNLGYMNEEQYAKIPDEYKGIRQLPDFETFKSRAKTQGSKMSEKALKDAYDKLSRGGS